MRKILLMLAVVTPLIGFGQETAMDAWKNLLDKKELADYFKGTFESLGIMVDDTKEMLTVYHKGDHFELVKGADSLKTDFFIHIKSENIKNMKAHGADNTIDQMESYRIMSVIFTPFTQSGLNNPNLTKKAFLRAGKVEEHIHVFMHSPDKKEQVSHTIVFVNKQWLLMPGIHGKAQREFHLSPENALDYQRHLFAAHKANTTKAWKSFLKWYKPWKETVSVKK